MNHWLGVRTTKLEAAKPKDTMNTRFLKEAREIEKRWENSGLLKGLDDRFVRSNTAVMLEGQRLWNETTTVAAATSVLLENQRLMNEMTSEKIDAMKFKRYGCNCEKKRTAPVRPVKPVFRGKFQEASGKYKGRIYDPKAMSDGVAKLRAESIAAFDKTKSIQPKKKEDEPLAE